MCACVPAYTLNIVSGELFVSNSNLEVLHLGVNHPKVATHGKEIEWSTDRETENQIDLKLDIL